MCLQVVAQIPGYGYAQQVHAWGDDLAVIDSPIPSKGVTTVAERRLLQGMYQPTRQVVQAHRDGTGLGQCQDVIGDSDLVVDPIAVGCKGVGRQFEGINQPLRCGLSRD